MCTIVYSLLGTTRSTSILWTQSTPPPDVCPSRRFRRQECYPESVDAGRKVDYNPPDAYRPEMHYVLNVCSDSTIVPKQCKKLELAEPAVAYQVDSVGNCHALGKLSDPELSFFGIRFRRIRRMHARKRTHARTQPSPARARMPHPSTAHTPTPRHPFSFATFRFGFRSRASYPRA